MTDHIAGLSPNFDVGFAIEGRESLVVRVDGEVRTAPEHFALVHPLPAPVFARVKFWRAPPAGSGVSIQPV